MLASPGTYQCCTGTIPTCTNLNLWMMVEMAQAHMYQHRQGMIPTCAQYKIHSLKILSDDFSCQNRSYKCTVPVSWYKPNTNEQNDNTICSVIWVRYIAN